VEDDVFHLADESGRQRVLDAGVRVQRIGQVLRVEDVRLSANHGRGWSGVSQ
jgi:hypothetical protein